jgi:hypothetical protein
LAAHTWDSARIHHQFTPVPAIDSGDTVMEGARRAVHVMIGSLGDEHGLEHRDACMPGSPAGDTRMIEIVDRGM